MSLDAYQKLKISGAIKKQSIDKIAYEDFIFPRAKVTNDDLLMYFYTEFCNKMNSDEKITDAFILKLLKAIDIVVCECEERQMKLNSNSIDINNMRKLYNSYTSKFELESKKDVIDYFDKINKHLIGNSLFNQNAISKVTSIKDEEVVVSTIQEKEKEAIKALNTKIEKQNGVIQNLTEENKELKKEQKVIEKQNRTLTKDLEKTNEKYIKLENESIELLKLNDDLSKTVDDQSLIIVDNKSLIDEQSKLICEYKKADEEREKIKVLEDVVAKLLLETRMNVNEIISVLNAKGFDTNANQVEIVLRNLKRKYTIESQVTSIPRNYKIQPATPNQGCTLELNTKTKELDVLFMCDSHIDENMDKIVNKYNAIYDYCINNGISTIVNLGDVFEGDFLSGVKANDYVKSNVENFLHNYPYDPNINTAILGGNHDKRMLYSGLDPFEEIAESRSDIIPIGYTYAFLNINNKNKITLHHPDSLYWESVKQSAILAIKDFYANHSLNREDYYIDILGHYHRCVTSIKDGYHLVPSFLNNKECVSKATHAKIYLDSNNKIESISFFPVSFSYDRKLYSTGEIEYVKQLKR